MSYESGITFAYGRWVWTQFLDLWLRISWSQIRCESPITLNPRNYQPPNYPSFQAQIWESEPFVVDASQFTITNDINLAAKPNVNRFALNQGHQRVQIEVWCEPKALSDRGNIIASPENLVRIIHWLSSSNHSHVKQFVPNDSQLQFWLLRIDSQEQLLVPINTLLTGNPVLVPIYTSHNSDSPFSF